MDSNPDYDASDELEYGASWFTWILRGVPAAGVSPGVTARTADRRSTRSAR